MQSIFFEVLTVVLVRKLSEVAFERDKALRVQNVPLFCRV